MTRKVAGRASGGMIKSAPRKRSWFEDRFGPLDDASWDAVCIAFREFGYAEREFDVSTSAKGKNNDQGWETRKDKTLNILLKALSGIREIRCLGDFLTEASDSYSIEKFGHAAFGRTHAETHLRAAAESIQNAVTIIEAAKPLQREVASPAEARRTLTRSLHRALGAPRIATGYEVSSDTAESDLGEFEQMISELEIHVAGTPASLSAFVRKAVSGK